MSYVGEEAPELPVFLIYPRRTQRIVDDRKREGAEFFFRCLAEKGLFFSRRGRIVRPEGPHQDDLFPHHAGRCIGTGREHVIGPFIEGEYIAFLCRARLVVERLGVKDGDGVAVGVDPGPCRHHACSEQGATGFGVIGEEATEFRKKAGFPTLPGWYKLSARTRARRRALPGVMSSRASE